MSGETGLTAVNPDVLFAIHDMVGRVIMINTVDKKRYSGVLGAISQDLIFGVHCVVEITKENQSNLLRTESEVIDKMMFQYKDVVDFAFITEDEKKTHIASKFATDRQYHAEAPLEDQELQAWEAGDDDECIGVSIEDENTNSGSQSSRRNNHNNGTGWSVNEMFAVNEKLNVKTSFKPDLTQYTTVEVVGTDEDRARAERLAREIESNTSSKFMANLENDDDERDLDKITRQEDFDNGNNQRGGKRNNNYNQQSQQRRNQNITPNGQPVNRRAEGLRGDRRNSGGSSANNSRYNPQNVQQNYQPPPQQQQQQQNQKGGNYGNRRQNEDYRDNDWQMAKGKGQNQGDHSFRQQQKQMLDPRPSSKQPEVDKGQGSGSRVTELKNWGNEFSIATSPKEQSPAPGSSPVPQGNSGNAWNRGPPTSLVAKGAAPETIAHPVEPDASVTKAPHQKKEELPSTSEEVSNESSDGQQDDGDTISLTGRSETSSVVTTKSSSFKFNINAPEFKPRVTPTTPTPTTPTGPAPPSLTQVQPQQFVPQVPEYQQHPGMIPQGGPQGPQMGMPGMAPHMGPGGIPQNQGQPVMMWQPGQQAYQPNQQYPVPQGAMAGVPGQMYGPAAIAPTTVNQSAPVNQQIPTSAAGGPPVDGRQMNSQQRRDGEYRETQPMFYSYGQTAQMMAVQPQFYQAQYQGAIPQQYQMKAIPQQGHQGPYQQRFQQPQQQQLYMVPQGQNPQQRYQGPPHQTQQFAGEQGGPQSHPNSQPTTPGPRGGGGGDMNGQKNQQGPQQTQNGNTGMHREPEAGSNASQSGSASSQSGQRSGSPQNNAVQNVPQHQQGPPPPHHAPPHVGAPHALPPHAGMQHGGPQQATMIQVPTTYMMQPMHSQMPPYYQATQPMYYPQVMMPPQMQMQQNQHGQQSLMGERADTGYAQNNFFDYRTMPAYQQNQQHQQMHGGHMPRQNSVPQQYGGNQVLKV